MKLSMNKPIRRIAFLAVLSCCFRLGFGQDGWVNRNPIPTPSTLYSIALVDSQTAFFVGEKGNLWKSVDGGDNFIPIPIATENNLDYIRFFDRVNGVAAGPGALFRTSDGGMTWQSVSATMSGSLFVFISSKVGFRLLSGLGIQKTTDGGLTWTTKHKLEWYAGRIFFKKPNLGFALGQGYILRTVDEGMTWDSIPIGSPEDYLRDIHFIDDKIGFLVGSKQSPWEVGTFLKTIDGGLSWKAETIEDYNGLLGAHFFDSSTGYACGFNGTLRKTRDGGKSWISLISKETRTFSNIQFLDSTRGFVFGENELLRTRDGGSSWESLLRPTYHSVQLIDEQTGFIAGERGVILKTTDGGSDWKRMPTGTDRGLSQLHFPTRQVGYAVGRSGTVLKTDQAGEAWLPLSTGLKIDFAAVRFLNRDTGIVAAVDGTILKTENGGDKWSVVHESMPNAWLASVSMVDDEIGYAVGGSGQSPGWVWMNARDTAIILKTTDGGNHWAPLSHTIIAPGAAPYHNIHAPMTSVEFVSRDTGFAASGEYIFKTVDGGDSWRRLFASSSSEQLLSTCFLNRDTGFAIGSGNEIMKTNTGGESPASGLAWWSQNRSVTPVLYACDFYGSRTGFAVGSEGLILQFVEGGESIGIRKKNPDRNFLMSRAGNWEFRLNANTIVEARLLDLQGRRIRSFRAILPAGTHSLPWPEREIGTAGILDFKAGSDREAIKLNGPSR
jgi:photosystem II stability/assembly factor-like uncharacterized protein